jgi:hypothetical protein
LHLQYFTIQPHQIQSSRQQVACDKGPTDPRLLSFLSARLHQKLIIVNVLNRL